MTFTASDYPTIVPLLDATRTCYAPLVSNLPDPDEYHDFDAAVRWTYLDTTTITTTAWDEVVGNKDPEALRRRLRIVGTDDQRVTIEVDYFPAIPDYFSDEEDVRVTYDATRLSEIITLSDFAKASKRREEWVVDSFAYTDAQALYFEVVPSGDQSKFGLWNENFDLEFELFTGRPYAFQHNGVDYDLYVWVSEE